MTEERCQVTVGRKSEEGRRKDVPTVYAWKDHSTHSPGPDQRESWPISTLYITDTYILYLQYSVTIYIYILIRIYLYVHYTVYDYPGSIIATHAPRQRALSEAEDGSRVWHLFKQVEVEDPRRSPFLNKKMVSEIYLPRMLSTKVRRAGGCGLGCGLAVLETQLLVNVLLSHEGRSL